MRKNRGRVECENWNSKLRGFDDNFLDFTGKKDCVEVIDTYINIIIRYANVWLRKFMERDIL